MGCYIENDQEGTHVNGVLTFSRDQLLYDIKNYCYIEGHVMETENNHQRHTVQDVGDEGNVDRVTRVLDLNVAKCREMLYPYIKHPIHRPELDDRLKEKPSYGMVLKLPENFSQTTLNLLEQLIHEYLVCRTVADWMSITNPAKVETWAIKAQEAERGVMECVNTRMTRTRIRLHPF